MRERKAHPELLAAWRAPWLRECFHFFFFWFSQAFLDFGFDVDWCWKLILAFSDRIFIAGKISSCMRSLSTAGLVFHLCLIHKWIFTISLRNIELFLLGVFAEPPHSGTRNSEFTHTVNWCCAVKAIPRPFPGSSKISQGRILGHCWYSCWQSITSPIPASPLHSKPLKTRGFSLWNVDFSALPGPCSLLCSLNSKGSTSPLGNSWKNLETASCRALPLCSLLAQPPPASAHVVPIPEALQRWVDQDGAGLAPLFHRCGKLWTPQGSPQVLNFSKSQMYSAYLWGFYLPFFC